MKFSNKYKIIFTGKLDSPALEIEVYALYLTGELETAAAACALSKTTDTKNQIDSLHIKVCALGKLFALFNRIPNDCPLKQQLDQSVNKFIVILKGCPQVLWVQQILDLELLLVDIKESIESVVVVPPKSALASFFSAINPFKSKDDDLSLPMPKSMFTYWRKCLHCSHLQYGTLIDNIACTKCGKAFLMKTPVFKNIAESRV
jgi:hypothetical protein